MFYHPFLLHHQHKMQLNMPWLAATLGIKKLKKETVLHCDTSKLCGFILKFLQSESTNPEKRLSLRLSTMLVHGTVLIWRFQVATLGEDITHFIQRRERETVRLTALFKGEEQEFVEPKAVVKKKRVKRIIVETPESLVGKKIRSETEGYLEPIAFPDVMPEGEPILQARLDEITLREEVPIPAQDQFLLDDFGEPGILHPPPPVSLSVPDLPPQTITVQAEVHVSALPEEIVESHIQVEKPSEIEQPEPTVAEPLEKEKEVISVVEEREAEKQQLVPEVLSGEKEEAEASALAELVEGVGVLSRDTKAKVKSIADLLRMKRVTKRSVAINQKMQIYEDEEDYMKLIQDMIKRLPDFVPIKKFWPEWEETIQHRAVDDGIPEGRRTGTTRSSELLETHMDTPSIGSMAQLTPQEVASAEHTFPSTPKKRPLPEETIIEVIPPAANGAMSSPSKRRKKMPVERAAKITSEAAITVDLPPQEVEIPMEQEQPILQSMEESLPELEITRQKEISPPRSGRRRDGFGVKWSSDIMRIVNERKNITPIDLCKELDLKVTKLNMATIFATLLALAKARHVLLHAAADSLELENVEKGPKEF